MIITDRNEAFKHNSCKKLAQLAKVIFSMSSQARDRRNEILRVQNKYENMIADLVESHHTRAEAIAKALVQFRKSCVDRSCREWGTLYKRLKMNLANLSSTQNAKISEIIDEAQQLANDIKSIQTEALRHATEVLECADGLQRDLKQKTRPTTTSRKTIREALRPIFDKMDELNDESERRVKALKSEHAKEIAANRAEIAKFLKEELIKRRGTFLEYRDKLTQLEDDVQALRDQYREIVDSRDAMTTENKQTRNSLVSETKSALRRIRLDCKSLKAKEKMNKKTHMSEMNDLKQQFHIQKKNHKAEIDAIRAQTHSQRRQRKSYAEAHEANMKKRSNEDQLAEENMKKKLLAEKKRKGEIQGLIMQNISECEADTAKLIESMRELINTSIERMNTRVIVVNGKIEKQEADEKKRLDEEKEEFVKHGKERLEVLESAIEAQISADKRAQKNQKHLVKHLKRDYDELRSHQNAELEGKEKKLMEDIEKVKRLNKQRTTEKEADLEKVLERRAGENQKKMNQLEANFGKDLESKRVAVEKEVQESKEKQLEAIQQNFNPEKQQQEHEVIVNKAKARVTAIETMIKNALNEREKKIAHLENEIAHQEKLKRQLERKKKTESQSIDEEYERKIQVEQVHLREKVDNIAKMYDAEENKRGIEIIEAIRKVKETNNHTDDFLSRKRHELQSQINDYDKTINELRKEIETYKGNGREAELREKIATTETNMNNVVQAIKEQIKKEQSEIQDSIRRQTEANEQKLSEIEKQSKLDSDKFQKEIEFIQDERQKSSGEVEKAKEECIREFDAKQARLVKEHSTAIERIKARIVAAHKLRDEITEKYETERSKLMEQNRAEIEQRSQENIASNANTFSRSRQTSEDLSETITNLSKKQTDTELKMIDPESRESEKRKMNGLKLEIESLAESQESTFQTFYTTIRSAPTRVRELEPQVTLVLSPAPPRDRKMNATSSGRSSRRDVSRVITPVERSRRRPQVLITPQLSV